MCQKRRHFLSISSSNFAIKPSLNIPSQPKHVDTLPSESMSEKIVGLCWRNILLKDELPQSRAQFARPIDLKVVNSFNKKHLLPMRPWNMQIAQVDHAYTITREVLEGVEWIKKAWKVWLLIYLSSWQNLRNGVLISLTQTARVQFALGFNGRAGAGRWNAQHFRYITLRSWSVVITTSVITAHFS